MVGDERKNVGFIFIFHRQKSARKIQTFQGDIKKDPGSLNSVITSYNFPMHII
jgi:hypothetical protein